MLPDCTVFIKFLYFCSNLCIHCDNSVIVHIFVEVKALQGLCYKFVIIDKKNKSSMSMGQFR